MSCLTCCGFGVIINRLTGSPVTCPICKGSGLAHECGLDEDTEEFPCPECQGSSYVLGALFWTGCPTCNPEDTERYTEFELQQKKSKDNAPAARTIFG